MQIDEQKIFEEALALTTESERQAYLKAACCGDEDLIGHIVGLLNSAHDAGSFMAKRAADSMDLTADVENFRAESNTIGNYKLLEPIGEGGFGVVYMAEQRAPIRRKVALKVIKPGMDTKEVIGRFEAERQALAMMNHPNIAKVLDAGTTDAGHPYFAMELVRGTPIVEFCDENSLSMEERLDLFVPVCRAIQHAHQKAIIHRDIKPSNVLVTMHDDKAVPKVIDFGIAKALHTELTARTLFTQFKQLIGTPVYMSPEQAQMSGLDVDTRADIYALGVLLYELLTGSTPFEPKELLQGGYDDICRRIREQEPPKPSNRISTMDDGTRASAASSRKANPNRLGGLVRGDLDWIVMKAMEKERTRRYQTANDFADDVRRYLSGEPVLACPPTFHYRAAKFVRRYRRQVAVAVAFAVVLCLSSVVAWSLYLKARGSERNAIRAQKIAQTTAVELEHQLGNANVRRLAAQSQALKVESPVTSVLLAAESLKTSRRYDTQTQTLAFEALTSALGHLSGDPLSGGAAVDCTTKAPDGTWVAAGRADGSLSIHAVGNGADLKRTIVPNAHKNRFRAMTVSPDGRIYSLGRDRFIRGWDVDKNLNVERAMEIPCFARSLAISPDGQWMAAGAPLGEETGNKIFIWNLVNKTEETRTIEGLRGDLGELYFTPNSKQLVTKDDKILRAWDVETGKESKVLRGHKNLISQFAVSRNGRWIASAGYDQTVRLWDLSASETKDVSGVILVEAGKVFESIAISPDNRWLAAGCDDNFVYLWDLNDPNPTSSQQILYGHSDEIHALEFTGDSTKLISGCHDRTARVWGLHASGVFHPLAVLQGHQDNVNYVDIGPNAQWIVTGSKDGTLRRWALRPHNLAGTYPDKPIRSSSDSETYASLSVAVSTDDRWIASGGGKGGLRLWRMDAIDSHPQLLLEHKYQLHSLAFAESGDYLFSASGDGTVRRWELRTEGKHSIPIIEAGENNSFKQMAVPPNADYVFAIDRQDELWMWRRDSGMVVRLKEMGKCLHVAIHPDGRQIYIAQKTQPGLVTEWRITEETIERSGAIVPLDEAVSAMAVNEQGELLAVGTYTGTIHLFTISDGKLTKTTELLTDRTTIDSLVFTADGKRLYAGAGRVLRGWDLDHAHDKPALILRGYEFRSIDVTRDGRRLVSAGWGQEVPNLWWLRSDDLLRIAKQKAGRELSEQELREFNIVRTGQ